MLAFLLRLFRLVWLFLRGHQALVLENLALRQQLSVYKRKQKRPRLTRWDRLFWIALAGSWRGWRKSLFVVHPDTVVRWQRQRFRKYWAALSKPGKKSGRPPIGKHIRELIQTMALANGLWRAPRIHGELLKLGIEVSERTVSRILRTIERPPSQTWKTFLKNHIGEIVAADFFTVPTVRMRVLFVFLVLGHRRRKVLHFAVTEHPTAEWAGYGDEFRNRIRSLGMKEVITAARSPWQNAFVERVIGSIRRECLDHAVVLNQRHLTRLLRKYFDYYHRYRTHLSLDKDAPEPRAVMKQGTIIAIPQVGGLHHRYERVAA